MISQLSLSLGTYSNMLSYTAPTYTYNWLGYISHIYSSCLWFLPRDHHHSSIFVLSQVLVTGKPYLDTIPCVVFLETGCPFLFFMGWTSESVFHIINYYEWIIHMVCTWYWWCEEMILPGEPAIWLIFQMYCCDFTLSPNGQNRPISACIRPCCVCDMYQWYRVGTR